MISTKFILISLTAFTVVLAKTYNNNGEKVMESKKKPGTNDIFEDNEYILRPPIELTELGYVDGKEFGIKIPDGAEHIRLFKRQVSHEKTSKACTIMVRKIEHQPGVCFRLIDNTPACHNDEYLAIDHDC